MNIGNLTGIELGIKALNGRFKPKYTKGAIVCIIIFLLFIVGFILALVYGMINLNLEFIIMPTIGIWAFGYMLLISPYTQRRKNYSIEFEKENTLKNFKLFYKGKLVNIDYKIDEEGKIEFKYNKKKIDCISYSDNSKMSNFEKYKIINYFSKWLSDNNLLSSKVTLTFERL